MDKDQIIEQIASLVSNREKYQRLLGQLALSYRKNFGGIESLKALSEDIKERHGLIISPSTLHNYSWVEDRLMGIEIPEDVPFRVRQIIAGTENPEEWSTKLNEGMSTKEIERAIKGEKPKPLIECPHCHFAFERPNYIDAQRRTKEAIKDFKY